jgi:tetratricopeptide (TPR) repeat protein
VRLWHRLQTGRGVDARAVLREIDLLLPTFERLHDELGLANAWKQAGEAHHFLGQVETAEAAFARALDHAVRAGDEGLTVQSTSTSWLMTTAATGPRPAVEGIALCERVLAEARTPRLRTSALLELGFLNGIAGDLERASVSFEEAKLLAQELGFPLVEATVSERAGRVALLAGDAEWAERELRTCVTIVERLGARSVLSTEAAYLARALLEQGRDDEAAGFAEIAGEAASDDDLLSQILLRGARARLLSHGGEHEAAEAAARDCVELARTTDMLDQQGEALLDLAEVLDRAGRPGDAVACAGEAAEVFTRKQAVLAARRAANRA